MGTGTLTRLTPAPTPLACGERDIDDGPTATAASTVTNSGSEAVTLTAIVLGGTDASQFEYLSGSVVDCFVALTLPAGQSCDVRGRFDPGTTGAKTAALTISSNAADVAVTLTGTGTQTELSRSPATLALGARELG